VSYGMIIGYTLLGLMILCGVLLMFT